VCRTCAEARGYKEDLMDGVRIVTLGEGAVCPEADKVMVY
jgi:sulfur relay (sulfurtransferase) complex TusBCD TusD component (DsrE family)